MPAEKILVVDDEQSMAQFLGIVLRKEGYHVVTANNGRDALDKVKAENFNVVITDIKMPGMDGIQLLQGVKKHDPSLPVVIMTAYASQQSAIDAVNLGAFQYLIKNAKNDEIKLVVRNAIEMRKVRAENQYLKRELKRGHDEKQIIGSSEQMIRVFKMVEKVADSEATNADLEREVAEGRFRADLFYRLNVIPIKLPSLRQRRDDIPLLVDHFLRRHAQNNPGKTINKDAMDLLLKYDWPGNVRELENVIERALILDEGGIIGADDLPDKIRFGEIHRGSLIIDTPTLTLEDLEKEYILKVLNYTRWQKKKTSDILGINASTLYRKLIAYGVEKPAGLKGVEGTVGDSPEISDTPESEAHAA